MGNLYYVPRHDMVFMSVKLLLTHDVINYQTKPYNSFLYSVTVNLHLLIDMCNLIHIPNIEALQYVLLITELHMLQKPYIVHTREVVCIYFSSN